MSDYKRFVSYLYEYIDDKKSENCGYVKVELRLDICRMQFHLNAASLPLQSVVNVYGFLPEEGRFKKYLLGSLSSGNGGISQMLTLPAQGSKSTPALIDLHGLILLAPDKFYGTQWKETPILPHAFTSSEPDVEKEEKADLHIASANSFAPFDDDEICDCVRISIQDLPMLSSRGIRIGCNPFIRHGYQAYQHLLLGRINDNGKSLYIFGVPGTYSANDQFMASMYGFTFFKSGRVTDTPDPSPKNGYWYRILS